MVQSKDEAGRDAANWAQTYACSCGTLFGTEAMHTHINQCAGMQKDVGQLYQTLGQHHMKMMNAKDPKLMRRVLFMVKSF